MENGITPPSASGIYSVAARKEIERATSPVCALGWLRGLDLNQRPSGYEPDELPDCSTPRSHYIGIARNRQTGLGETAFGNTAVTAWITTNCMAFARRARPGRKTNARR